MDRFVDFCVIWGIFLPMALVDKFVHNYLLRVICFLFAIVIQFFWVLIFGLPFALLLLVAGIHDFAKGG